MRTKPSCLVVLCAVASLSFSPAYGQEGGKAETPARAAGQAVTDADIETMVDDLDANRFSQRQAAGQKRKQVGKGARAALMDAALGDNREPATRAMAILKEHFNKGNDDLKEAAKEALKKLAAGKKTTIARIAKEVLEPEPPKQQPRFRGPRLGGGQIQIQFQAGGAGRKMQVKTINGVKEIKVTENEQQIKIVDDPNNGIQVEITEKVDGKEKTRQFKAKDAAELKKKHPEAHKVYEKFKQGGGIQFQFNQGPLIPLQIMPPAGKPLAQPLKQAEVNRQLKKVSSQIDEAQKLLDDLSTQDKESLKKAIGHLEEAKQTLENARAKIQE